MKRTLIVIMAVCAALAFTACGKSSSNTETTPAPTTAEPETKEPATTPAATLEAPGDTAEFKILTCDVVSVSDTLEDMTVKNGDTEVKFNLNGVVIETTYELKGEFRFPSFIREISGDDAANAAIVLVLDAREDMEVKTMTGSVTWIRP